MENYHTPGPWHAIEYAGYIELHPKPFYGEVNLLNKEECGCADKNAQLAAAAPDLLEALQNLMGLCIFTINDCPEMKHASEVIKKATNKI